MCIDLKAASTRPARTGLCSRGPRRTSLWMCYKFSLRFHSRTERISTTEWLNSCHSHEQLTWLSGQFWLTFILLPNRIRWLRKPVEVILYADDLEVLTATSFSSVLNDSWKSGSNHKPDQNWVDDGVRQDSRRWHFLLCQVTSCLC